VLAYFDPSKKIIVIHQVTVWKRYSYKKEERRMIVAHASRTLTVNVTRSKKKH